MAEPVSVRVDSFGTGNVSDEQMTQAVRELWDLTPNGIITGLQLRRAIFRDTAAYGHFGREGEGFTWEKLDRVEDVRSHLGLQVAS